MKETVQKSVRMNKELSHKIEYLIHTKQINSLTDLLIPLLEKSLEGFDFKDYKSKIFYGNPRKIKSPELVINNILIRTKRCSLGLSQRELADTIGKNQKFISRIEHKPNTYKIDKSLIKKIAIALDLNINELIVSYDSIVNSL